MITKRPHRLMQRRAVPLDYFTALVTDQPNKRRNIQVFRRDSAEVDSPEFEVTYAATTSDPARRRRWIDPAIGAAAFNAQHCKEGYTACLQRGSSRGFHVSSRCIECC